MAKKISGSVGKGGQNLPADVMLVQQLLNLSGVMPPLETDGVSGPKTEQAIVKFQSKFLKRPDGRVDPGGKTFRELIDASFGKNVAVTPPPESTINWNGDSSQWSQAKKIQSLAPPMRPKVTTVLEELEQRGFQPKIFFAWRSVAVQLELFRKGHTTVKFSFHNAQLRDGTPNAYAADIIDRRWAWQPAAEANGFWTALGEEAKKEGLYWGGDWVSFKDWAHVQYFPNSKLADIKHASGR